MVVNDPRKCDTGNNNGHNKSIAVPSFEILTGILQLYGTSELDFEICSDLLSITRIFCQTTIFFSIHIDSRFAGILLQISNTNKPSIAYYIIGVLYAV